LATRRQGTAAAIFPSMPEPHHEPTPLIAPDVDAVGLFKQVEERFSDFLEIHQLVAASDERALFVARDRVLKRRVGLRVHLEPDTRLRCWFERETEVFAALDHPVLRDVYSAGHRDDWAYRIVRWVDGEGLVYAVARGPRPIPTVLHLARHITSALEYVHTESIVLRRLVPEAVMIDNNERTFLIDLRYANVLLDVASPIPGGATDPFLAPEVRDGGVGDPGSDVYGAGALLYYAVTGTAPPLDASTVTSPRALREACPAALERVILRALKPEIRQRYFTAAEMREDLLSDLGDHETEFSITVKRGVVEDAAAWEKRLRRALGDDYELLEELGAGGFGRVYRVRDLQLEREVALKVLHPYLTTDPVVVERFRREARLAAQVVHPYIANTYDFGGRTGLLWYTMEFVRGANLGRLVQKEGRQPAERVVRILQESLDALGYAHQRGLVHRDLKPENILIESATENVRIADFGLAIPFERSEGSGTLSSHSGTPDFAAPEQLLGESVDHRADIYSLSLVALFALSGRLPFGGGSVEATVARQVAGLPPELDHLRNDVPDSLLRVLLRGASRDPAGRFGSAEEYAQALEEAMRPGSGRVLGLFRRLSGPG
jgi:serine/threonine protein kinase